MKKVKDDVIKGWINGGERFEGRAVSENLYLRFRKSDSNPTWRFRYGFAGKSRIMTIGHYHRMSRPEAEKQVKLLAAKVALGHDVAMEKQERKANAVRKLSAKNDVMTVGALADQYYERMVAGRIKHPQIIRSKIEKIIKPNLGNMPLAEVRPTHIDMVLQKLVARNTPTVANNTLRLFKRLFNFAIRRELMLHNPAAAFGLDDAGGSEKGRDRALSEEELVIFFRAMRDANGFSVENYLTFKLLLAVPVRKMELAGARWEEFDLDGGVWHLAGERTKTGNATDIPLAPQAIGWLLELKRLGGGSPWVLPARKMQSRMLPHISESTLCCALGKVKHGLEHFIVHDLRRTARTHLSRMTSADVGEVCLNHVPTGMRGKYDKHTYYAERKDALEKLAEFICECECRSISPDS